LNKLTKCAICGGEVIRKKVDEFIKKGNDAVLVEIDAEVCMQCGEIYYLPNTVSYLHKIRNKVEKGTTFKKIGELYTVATYISRFQDQGTLG